MPDIRSLAIRVASRYPEIRGSLLPLIKNGKVASAFSTEADLINFLRVAGGPSYQIYVKKKEKAGEAPLSQEAWEAKVLGKKVEPPPEGKAEASPDAPPKKEKKAPAKKEEPSSGKSKVKSFYPTDPEPGEADKDLADRLDTDQYYIEKYVGRDEFDYVQDIFDHASPKAQNKAIKNLASYQKTLSGEDADNVGKLVKALKGRRPKAAAPGKPYSKHYAKPVTDVMDAYSLTDGDAGEVLKFKKDRPKGHRVSDAVLLQRFLAKAKPETKERMKGVSPAEFVKMLGAIMDDEEGTAKVGGNRSIPSHQVKASQENSIMSDKALRSNLIKLAAEHPEFRKDLRPLLKGAAHFPPESIGEEKPGPKGVLNSDAQKPWAKGEFTQRENREALEKQEDGDYADGKADPVGKQATSAMIRRMLIARVITSGKEGRIRGRMVVDLQERGATPFEPIALRFTATVSNGLVQEFQPFPNIMGPGADSFMKLYKGIVQEALSNGAAVIEEMPMGIVASSKKAKEVYPGESSPASKDQNKPEYWYGMPPRGVQGSGQTIRSRVIRLAAEHPEFRKDLLPLLK